MHIEGYVMRAVQMMIIGWKMEIHWSMGSQCLNRGWVQSQKLNIIPCWNDAWYQYSILVIDAHSWYIHFVIHINQLHYNHGNESLLTKCLASQCLLNVVTSLRCMVFLLKNKIVFWWGRNKIILWACLSHLVLFCNTICSNIVYWCPKKLDNITDLILMWGPTIFHRLDINILQKAFTVNKIWLNSWPFC